MMSPTLYKYYDFNQNFKDSLRNGYLWFSDPSKFNDPFEFKLQVDKDLDDNDILEYFELYKKLSANPSNSKIENFNNVLFKYRTNPKEFIKFYLAPFVRHISNFGVCCFSSIKDNILMWSHYANSHRGVVVEFDPKLMYESIYKLNESVKITATLKIIYSNNFPIISISSSHEKTSNEIEKVVFTKSIDWEYEKEIRIISHSIGKHLINRNCIKQIYLGHKFSYQDKREINQLLITYFPNQDIPIKEMTIDDRTYSLKIKD